MANPNNAIGTNSAYKGRTSANAFNDDLSVYSRGIMSGWACAPNSGMSVVLGGDGTTRDVAVAEDNAGNKTTVNNISGAPVVLNIGSAPASNSRIDAIVAYVDNPPQGSANIADNYEACGLIAVQGTASSSPIKPTDGIIRTAITADGASGSTAYYVVLAYVTIQAGTTDLTDDNVTAGDNAMIQARNIPKITSQMIDFTTLGNQSTYFDIGKIRVMFGRNSVSAPSGQETQSAVIPFGFSFAEPPKVVVTVDGWLPLRMCVTNQLNANSFRVVINQDFGSTLTVGFNWIAIGLMPD